MSASPETLGKIQAIVDQDGRFRLDAYVFTLEALSFTLERLSKAGKSGHIDGRELLLGARDYGKKLFGYLGATVFESWGLKETGDFGEVVFSLVDAGLLSKQETDTKADFEGVYDFREVFEASFIH